MGTTTAELEQRKLQLRLLERIATALERIADQGDDDAGYPVIVDEGSDPGVAAALDRYAGELNPVTGEVQ